MAGETADLTLRQRALLIISAVLVYAVNFWPSPQVRNAWLNALGNPEFAGFEGIFLPHLLLYSTLLTVIAAFFWFAFVRARILPAQRARYGLHTLRT